MQRDVSELKSQVALPDFDTPPVVEVAVATAFRPVVKLGTAALGLLWDSKFRAAFPRVEEQARVAMPLESFDGPTEGPTFSLQLVPTAPPPRLWLLDDRGTQLVQVQNDWLARNWRKMDSPASYPRYPNLRASFREDIGKMLDFLGANDLGVLDPTQCEITYINHVAPLIEGGPARVDEILSFHTEHPEFLPEPETVRFAAQYVMSVEGSPVGRLHVSAEPAVRRSDGAPVTILTLTARGRPLGEGLNGILAFLDLGHEWVVRAFDGLTRPEAHRAWGKHRAE